MTPRDPPTGGGKRVMIVGSFAPSLIRFRGPLISAMIARGHRVVALAPEIDDATAAALGEIGAEPQSIAISNASLNPAGFARSLRALRSLVRDHRPDVILGYTVKPVILTALAGWREKVPTKVALITGLGFAFTGGREMKRRVSRLAASFLYRTALRKADVIMFQNDDDQALFRKLRLVPAGKVTHVVNGSGVDLDHFAPAPLPAGASFLMIARLLKDKGIREFAEAAKRLKAEHPNVPIGLVGYLDPSPDSLSQAELDELIRGGIEYHGRLEDVRAAIARASVYVLPSYREGMPRSVLEAMAMGRAIITTDAPGCRETVVPGENGILVPPGDVEALYQAMLSFVRQPEKLPRMGAASRLRAEALYDVHRVNETVLGHCGL